MKNQSLKPGVQKSYIQFTRRRTFFIFLLVSLLVVIVLFSLCVGSVSIKLKDIYTTILSGISSKHFSSTHLNQVIIWKLRLPRILMGIIAGMGLAVAGAVLQGILRNPLASPYTLGIASAAAFGASFATVLGADIIYRYGLQISNPQLLVISAFVFSLVPTLIVFVLAKFREATPQTIIFAGIAMMYLFSASTSLLQYIGSEEQVAAIVYWMFGSLSKSSWPKLLLTSVITFTSSSIFLKWSWDFNALSSGDEVAKSLGVNIGKVRLGGLILASLTIATAVAFLGTIGFIGLVAPHITRILIGENHRFLLPASSLMGGGLMVAADTVARTIISPQILPVGILTSFMGVPFFLYLIIKRKKVY